jgi:hypothetical protein
MCGTQSVRQLFCERSTGHLFSNLQLFRSHIIELADHGVTFAFKFFLHPLEIVDFRNLGFEDLHHAVPGGSLLEQAVHRGVEMEDCLEHTVLFLNWTELIIITLWKT